MSKSNLLRSVVSTTGASVCLLLCFLAANAVNAADLKVMKMGLGSGTVTSNPAGINCGVDCDESFGNVAVTLTATAAAGSTFAGWDVDQDADASTTADCTGALTCVVSMNVARSARPVFNLSPAIPTLASFTAAGIQAYLTANPNVNTAARFIKALPDEYKRSWILMTRSESLQTGTAQMPRILLPSANAQFVFTVGMVTHSSYPGAHPNAIEYMQWDAVEKNFRFHEIVLDAIPAQANFPARTRGVSIDDAKCFACHSTRNVPNPSSSPGTTGIPPGIVKAKNKPNWDSYDSWGGMTPFNRDRIYQGSVEAAAFRKFFNPWTWRTNDSIRSLIEQLKLQPPGVGASDVITRRRGGVNDGHINFAFDAAPPVLAEPAPVGSAASINTAYAFDGVAGAGPATSVTRGGSFVTLQHSATPVSSEGRGVQLFDLLGGADGTLNPQRIADEVINHRYATGSVYIDPRPIALAITKRCLVISGATVTSAPALPALTVDLAFFNARNGMTIDAVLSNTRTRTESLPRRKADIQKIDLHRTGDVYLADADGAENGLIAHYGAATSAGTDTAMSRLRQEVFRRPNDAGSPDATVMGGIYVDRELHSINTPKIALYRYFLEPLGVSVDKWSMGVRGRSRTYTFADVFGSYENVLEPELRASLLSSPVAGLTDPNSCSQLITAVNSTLSSLPAVNAVPTFTDIQRIFNKSCIECHGGLLYPPYSNYVDLTVPDPFHLDFSEDEAPPVGSNRLDRSYENALLVTTADPTTSTLYRRITRVSEDCPFGMMPCGGPPLSKTDVETVRRWIVGPPSRPSTAGDPHIKTVDGVNYDFQSAGEFVLLRDEYLEVQARQTAVETEAPLGANAHTGLSSCVSVNSAVAVRIGGHRITYQPNLNGEPDPSGLQLRVDGKLSSLSKGGIPLPSGARIISTTAPGGIQIEAPGGTVVIITPGWWNHYQLWYMNIDVRNPRATQGVMGAIAPGNWLPALPDGSLLGPRPRDLHQRYVDLYEKFEGAWRVSSTTTLFDYAPGTSTSNFAIESWPMENPQSCALPKQPEGTPPKPPVKGLALNVAEQHCKAVVANDRRANCVQDVMATGEPEFAKTYLATERIDSNALPTAPVLGFPEDNQVDVAIPVTFTWSGAADADGEILVHKLCVWAAGARPNNNNCDPTSIKTSGGGRIICVLLAILLGCILIAVLIVIGMKNRRGLLALVALATLIAAILAYYLCGANTGATASKTVAELASGKDYFWKVIVEDGNGGSTESETRRFTTK